MIYELRIYHCAPGRMPALLKRFEETTLALWERHGIRQVGFWTVAVGPSNHELYYMLQWNSMEQRQERWSRFLADPEWIAKRTASESSDNGGPIVASVTNMLLDPTAFSALR